MPTSPGADYAGDDFYCDVALPDTEALRVVHEDDEVRAFHHTKPFWPTHVVIVRQVEEREGAAAVLTNLGTYQDSKHLHVHVHSGPQLRD